MDLIESKVLQLLEQLDLVEQELGQPELFQDNKKFKEVSRRHAYLNGMKEIWHHYQAVLSEIADLKSLIKEEQDPEMLETARQELEQLTPQVAKIQQEMEQALIPPDPLDSRSTIMELRAGTGGDEAAIFVGDCVRMYQLYADSRGWKYEALSATESERGGFKEYIMVLTGADVYKSLRHEAGTHRVQRVPETEAQGRVHTSAVTIAVMPEADEEEEIRIDEKDLRIDTMRSSGAGGQHVNTTDSAVRITHLPTNVVVYCQQERSQIKNRDKAMRLLQAKLNEMEKEKRAKEESDLRSSQVGSGDRSERIRTYNFPQNRVTDHRVEVTLYNLSEMMNGKMEGVIQPLIVHFHQQRLEQAGQG
jgi:peptide chain release factor 1